MAFMGIILMYLVIILVILIVCLFVCASCFIISGLIMSFKRRKAENGARVSQPWYVIVLRISGVIAAVPLVLFALVLVYYAVRTAIDRHTNLANALSRNDYVSAEKILENGADPDQRDRYGRTPLMCIAYRCSYVADSVHYEFSDDNLGHEDETDANDIKMMELLLEYGADINAQQTDICNDLERHTYQDPQDIYSNSDDTCGNTPLLFAIRDGRSIEVIDFLIDNGADVNLSNDCGFTPVLMCADNMSGGEGEEIMEELIDSGADINTITNFNQDILFLLERQTDRDVDGMRRLIYSTTE